jgi:hypothetical protein
VKQRLIAKITTVLQQVPLVGNLARQKFMAQFIIGLLKSRNVQFCEVAQHLNDRVKVASNETRIQDFFRQVRLDADALARLLLHLLPGQGPVRLCLDRTGWHFGRCQVNLLLVTAGRGAWQVPLYWQALANQGGNSNAAQRIALLERCVALLGRAQIAAVLGDREFVGRTWLAWLADQGLPFVVRMPKHHPLVHANGASQPVAALGLAPGQVRRFSRVQVDGVWGKVRVQALAEGDFHFLFASAEVADPAALYARRWGIEQCFQNLKGRGFDLQKSHLQCPHKLLTLVALASLAYAFCLRVGQNAAVNGRPIARKKHGHPATSESRHGLNIWRQITRPHTVPTDAIAQQVTDLLQWLVSQIACYQSPQKIVG